MSGLAEVTSPPYDVIAHDTEGQLLAADPHNVVRLILPRPGRAAAGTEYDEAARLLQDWCATGILVPEDRPALYVYEQRQAGGPPQPAAGRSATARPGGEVIQRGLIGALDLTSAAAGAVLPHEDVLPGPVTGRRQLMEATSANLEPIFLLYDGGGGAAAQLTAQTATQREPLLSVDTDDGLRHQLWAITDPAEHADVAADLSARQALIADGHHRYAAYLEIQARRQAAGAGPGPWDQGLALLVDSASYPPRIGAIHRLIPGLDTADAAARAKSAFTVRPAPSAGAGPAGAAAALELLQEAGSGGPAFLIIGRDETYLLTDPDPLQAEAAMPGRSPHWQGLAASVMQELLMPRLWGVRDDDPAVQIHHDAVHALAEAAASPPATAVLVPPMSAGDVQEVAARGERVPRKSTSIGPKPRTGLVIRSFGAG